MKQIIPYKKDIVFKTNIANITSISLEHEEKIKEGEVIGDFSIFGEYKIHNDTTEKELFKYRLPFSIDFTENIDKDSIKIDIEDFNYEIIESDVLRINIEFSLNATEIVLKKEVKVEEISDEELRELDEFLAEDDGEEDVSLEELERQLQEYTCFDKEVEALSKEITDNARGEIVEELDEDEEIEVLDEEPEAVVVELDNLDIEESILEAKDEMPVEQTEIREEEELNMEEIIKNVNEVQEENMEIEGQEIIKTVENEYVTYHIHIVNENESIDDIMKKYECSLEVIKMYNDITSIAVGDKIIIPDLNE